MQLPADGRLHLTGLTGPTGWTEMAAGLVERLVDSGRVPEPLLRGGIRAICALRLRQQGGSVAAQKERLAQLVAELSSSEIAVETEAANRQHYEVPAALFDSRGASDWMAREFFSGGALPLRPAVARAGRRRLTEWRGGARWWPPRSLRGAKAAGR